MCEIACRNDVIKKKFSLTVDVRYNKTNMVNYFLQIMYSFKIE